MAERTVIHSREHITVEVRRALASHGYTFAYDDENKAIVASAPDGLKHPMPDVHFPY